MFAGRVVEVGAGVTKLAVGDDVFGSVMRGAYAEYLAISEDQAIAAMPTNVSYAEAAAIPYGAGTALHFLTTLADVRPGERVLLLGASGQPLTNARRGLREALTLADDALRILRSLALAGVELPKVEPTRFWQRGRGGQLELVDLGGAVRSDPTRAAMGMAGPALELARTLLWDERADALRSDLPAELAARLGGRAPLHTLVRALVEAASR